MNMKPKRIHKTQNEFLPGIKTKINKKDVFCFTEIDSRTVEAEILTHERKKKYCH